MLTDADGAGVDRDEMDRVAAIVSLVDASDVERVDPPAGLWGRIAAAVAAEPDRDAAGAGTVVEYAIDADDVVVPVGDEWSRFARQNDAPELDELAPDRTLWSYFGSDEVRDVWRLLIARVRATQAPAHVPLRCDAPHMRRWFEMTITPEPDGVVRFRSAAHLRGVPTRGRVPGRRDRARRRPTRRARVQLVRRGPRRFPLAPDRGRRARPPTARGPDAVDRLRHLHDVSRPDVGGAAHADVDPAGQRRVATEGPSALPLPTRG